jgi:hypothetical protein
MCAAHRSPGGAFALRHRRAARHHFFSAEFSLGTKRTGKGRRKLGRKKRRMRAKIRHRKK